MADALLIHGNIAHRGSLFCFSRIFACVILLAMDDDQLSEMGRLKCLKLMRIVLVREFSILNDSAFK